MDMIKNNLPWGMSYCHLECEMSAVFEEDELLQDLGDVYENIETEGQNLVEWSPVGSVKERVTWPDTELGVSNEVLDEPGTTCWVMGSNWSKSSSERSRTEESGEKADQQQVASDLGEKPDMEQWSESELGDWGKPMAEETSYRRYTN